MKQSELDQYYSFARDLLYSFTMFQERSDARWDKSREQHALAPFHEHEAISDKWYAAECHACVRFVNRIIRKVESFELKEEGGKNERRRNPSWNPKT